MYDYEEHLVYMVSNCCGNTFEEVEEFCYICDTRTKNTVNEGVGHCSNCKEERDFVERYVCLNCDDICEPIEDYEYDQIRRDELKEMQYDCRTQAKKTFYKKCIKKTQQN